MPTLPNPKHEIFAQELAKGTSADASYERAGYKPDRKNASKLRQQPHILPRVAEILAEREQIHAQSTAMAIESQALTKEWIIARLKENAERALQATPARDADGNPIGDYKYEGSVANRALELLGKELGMFIDRHEVGKPGAFENLTDVELEREIAQRLSEAGLAKAGRTLN